MTGLSYVDTKKLIDFIKRNHMGEMDEILSILEENVKNHEELYHRKTGICQNCIDEYDHPVETTLYWVEDSHRAEWLCGDCASDWENESRELQDKYGEDEE